MEERELGTSGCRIRFERFERHPQLMVLSIGDDRPLDWPRAGEALQRGLLTRRIEASIEFITAAGAGRTHARLITGACRRQAQAEAAPGVPASGHRGGCVHAGIG